MATSGNRCAASLAVIAIALAAGCTAQHGQPAPARPGISAQSAQSAAPAFTKAGAPSFGGAALGDAPCLVNLPDSWKRAISAGTLWSGVWNTGGTGAPTPDGTGVLRFSYAANTAHLAIVGRNQRIVEDIGTIPREPTAQVTNNAITDSYVTFIENLTNTDTSSWLWRLYLYDRRSHVLKVVATNPVDAHRQPLAGGWVRPVLTDHYLYWLQAAPNPTGWGGSALMQYNLATGAIRTLYQGLSEAFVPYRSMVLFSAIVKNPPPFDTNTGNGPPEDLRAVDQTTGASVTPPAGITFPADGAETVISDGEALLWNVSAQPAGGMRAWRPAWQHSVIVLPDLGWPLGLKLHMSVAAVPRLYGNFVVFQPSETYVLDLRSNTFVALTSLAGSEEVSDRYLALWHYTSDGSLVRNEANGVLDRLQGDASVVDLSVLPDLPGRDACIAH